MGFCNPPTHENPYPYPQKPIPIGVGMGFFLWVWIWVFIGWWVTEIHVWVTQEMALKYIYITKLSF